MAESNRNIKMVNCNRISNEHFSIFRRDNLIYESSYSIHKVFIRDRSLFWKRLLDEFKQLRFAGIGESAAI